MSEQSNHPGIIRLGETEAEYLAAFIPPVSIDSMGATMSPLLPISTTVYGGPEAQRTIRSIRYDKKSVSEHLEENNIHERLIEAHQDIAEAIGYILDGAKIVKLGEYK